MPENDEKIDQEIEKMSEKKEGTVAAPKKTPESSDKKSMPWFKKIIWGLVILIIFVAIVQIAVADRYAAQVLVIEGDKKVGVNPTAEKLDFGDLSADTSATRYVTLKAGGANTFVYVFKFGSIAELVKLSKNGFVMQKGDEEKLEFTLYMPTSAPVGEKYTGHVWIFKVPKFW